MPGIDSVEPVRYLAYLVRLWRENGQDRGAWRAAVEDPQTGERLGFAGLEALFAFLKEQTDEPHRPTAQ